MRRFAALSTLLALGFVSTPAFAGGWADFVTAFSTSPCQDGWLGCVVGGQAVTPNLVRDGSGAPTPADLRVGWFDLDGLPGFSPFPELSRYSGKLTGSEPAVAQVDEPPAPTPTAPTPSPRPAPADGSPRPATPAITPAEAPSTGSRSGSRGSASSGSADGGVIADNAPSSGTSIRDVGRQLSGGTADDVKVPDSAVRTIAAAGDAAADGDCTNIKKLEPMAMLGKLTPEQRTCLDGEIAAAAKQTDKDKISRVLMANAWAANDKNEWEKLVKRHLDEIDRSDPDLSYKYAMHLARKGPGSADATIRWADVALENKTIWTGETYTNRVNALLKMRADAAQKAWKAAADKYTADASDANRAARDNSRNRTKVLAREWYEYAKSAGKGAEQAKALCVSAAGTVDYCEGA